ncbi:DUF1476 domain-containing protein [Robiginitomaculum antarcticum]|uniref:DUF1476 domain-containing protein n=1 Tax=Robiginitomaculum antarcticum TaxID=437507 RepID=UPI0003649FE2|nr:DUF1476 domain-containing protein [Robiginitomaculum antarcticum]
MSGFDERKGAAMKKFELDAEQEFKAGARRNKLLGLWAAPLIGHKDADAYAKEVIKSDFEEAGDMDVFRKVKADLDKAGASITDVDLRTKMDALMEEARVQIAEG